MRRKKKKTPEKGEKAVQLAKGMKKAPPPPSVSPSAGKGRKATKFTGGKSAVYQAELARQEKALPPAPHPQEPERPKTGGKTPQYTTKVTNQVGHFYSPGNFLPVRQDPPQLTRKQHKKKHDQQMANHVEHITTTLPEYTQQQFEKGLTKVGLTVPDFFHKHFPNTPFDELKQYYEEFNEWYKDTGGQKKQARVRFDRADYPQIPASGWQLIQAIKWYNSQKKSERYEFWCKWVWPFPSFKEVRRERLRTAINAARTRQAGPLPDYFRQYFSDKSDDNLRTLYQEFTDWHTNTGGNKYTPLKKFERANYPWIPETDLPQALEWYESAKKYDRYHFWAKYVCGRPPPEQWVQPQVVQDLDQVTQADQAATQGQVHLQPGFTYVTVPPGSPNPQVPPEVLRIIEEQRAKLPKQVPLTPIEAHRMAQWYQNLNSPKYRGLTVAQIRGGDINVGWRRGEK
jgi:hypothetical protein